METGTWRIISEPNIPHMQLSFSCQRPVVAVGTLLQALCVKYYHQNAEPRRAFGPGSIHTAHVKFHPRLGLGAPLIISILACGVSQGV